jgi:hypothetical protein
MMQDKPSILEREMLEIPRKKGIDPQAPNPLNHDDLLLDRSGA